MRSPFGGSGGLASDWLNAVVMHHKRLTIRSTNRHREWVKWKMTNPSPTPTGEKFIITGVPFFTVEYPSTDSRKKLHSLRLVNYQYYSVR